MAVDRQRDQLRLLASPASVIAAINGHCVGGGLEIRASLANLRIARENAGKLGLAGGVAGRAPRGPAARNGWDARFGRRKRSRLMAEGTTFGVDEAKALGLINAVLDVPASEFRAGALEYARKFVPPAKASRAVGFIKRAVTTGLEVGLEQGLALERELQQRLFEGQDAKEGLAAYNSRRPPQFSGKLTDSSLDLGGARSGTSLKSDRESVPRDTDALPFQRRRRIPASVRTSNAP